MSLAKLKTQIIKNNPKRSRFILALIWALGFSVALTPSQAAFTGDYALSKFILMNTNADGMAITPDSGLSIVFTGGNNGSGLPGTTDLVGVATGTGLVQFHFSYATLDQPGGDFAGYILGAAFTQLASMDGQSGDAMFPVSTGQSFGFRVLTQDNTGEPGILTISRFTAPAGAGPAVPEPGTGSLLMIVALAVIAIHRLRRISGTWAGAV